MPRFTRKIEDFICEKCGAAVKGNGYTNHCPICLWSKHVDVEPGDRSEACGGMMEPVSLIVMHGKYVISQRCQRCGKKRQNEAATNDDSAALIKLSTKNPFA